MTTAERYESHLAACPTCREVPRCEIGLDLSSEAARETQMREPDHDDEEACPCPTC